MPAWIWILIATLCFAVFMWRVIVLAQKEGINKNGK